MCNDGAGVLRCVATDGGLLFGAEMDIALEKLYFSDGIEEACEQIRCLIGAYFLKYRVEHADCLSYYIDYNVGLFRDFAVKNMAVECEMCVSSSHEGGVVFSHYGSTVKTVLVVLPVFVPHSPEIDVDLEDYAAVLGALQRSDTEFYVADMDYGTRPHVLVPECLSNGRDGFTLVLDVEKNACVQSGLEVCAKALVSLRDTISCSVDDAVFNEAQECVALN
jgi:hypothetical protein